MTVILVDLAVGDAAVVEERDDARTARGSVSMPSGPVNRSSVAESAADHPVGLDEPGGRTAQHEEGVVGLRRPGGDDGVGADPLLTGEQREKRLVFDLAESPRPDR